MPVRLQRRRVKGYRLPENARSVTRPGRWGNPYKPDDYGASDPREALLHCMADWREYARTRAEREPEWLAPLRGMDLACYCPVGAEHCHADLLLELANA